MERDYRAVYYVYVATDSLRRALEVGITPDLVEWLQTVELDGSTHECRYVVYYEKYHEVSDGVKREMKLSGLPRWWLRHIVMRENPELEFLNDSLVSRLDNVTWLE